MLGCVPQLRHGMRPEPRRPRRCRSSPRSGSRPWRSPDRSRSTRFVCAREGWGGSRCVAPAVDRPVASDGRGPGRARVDHRCGPRRAVLVRGDATARGALSCDVVREAANDLVEALQRMGLHHDGAITLDPLEAVVSDAAAEAERDSGRGWRRVGVGRTGGPRTRRLGAHRVVLGVHGDRGDDRRDRDPVGFGDLGDRRDGRWARLRAAGRGSASGWCAGGVLRRSTRRGPWQLGSSSPRSPPWW